MLHSSSDERSTAEHYFERGLRYDTIVHFLFFKYHDICMNLRTLKRRLREYGLRRRNKAHSEHETVVTRKLNMLEG